jgi:hypothetical protein
VLLRLLKFQATRRIATQNHRALFRPEVDLIQKPHRLVVTHCETIIASQHNSFDHIFHDRFAVGDGAVGKARTCPPIAVLTGLPIRFERKMLWADQPNRLHRMQEYGQIKILHAGHDGLKSGSSRSCVPMLVPRSRDQAQRLALRIYRETRPKPYIRRPRGSTLRAPSSVLRRRYRVGCLPPTITRHSVSQYSAK